MKGPRGDDDRNANTVVAPMRGVRDCGYHKRISRKLKMEYKLDDQDRLVVPTL